MRIDPETGEGLPGNPLAASLDRTSGGSSPTASATPSASRSTRRPGEVYVGNVGAEQLRGDRPLQPDLGTALQLRLALSRGRRSEPQLRRPRAEPLRKALRRPRARPRSPFFAYNHGAGPGPRRPCTRQQRSALSGIAFYDGGAFPASYDGALFFSDSVRGCIYVMFAAARRPARPRDPDPSSPTAASTPGSTSRSGPKETSTTSAVRTELRPRRGPPDLLLLRQQPPVARLTATKPGAPGR